MSVSSERPIPACLPHCCALRCCVCVTVFEFFEVFELGQQTRQLILNVGTKENGLKNTATTESEGEQMSVPHASAPDPPSASPLCV